jgi:hypothetical protein
MDVCTSVFVAQHSHYANRSHAMAVKPTAAQGRHVSNVYKDPPEQEEWWGLDELLVDAWFGGSEHDESPIAGAVVFHKAHSPAQILQFRLLPPAETAAHHG